MSINLSTDGSPFKDSLMFYILKNVSIIVHIKLIQCNRSMKESLKRINGFFCDHLTVYHLELARILSIENGKLEYVTEFTDHRLTALNPLVVRDKLKLCNLFDENIIGLLPKMNIKNIKIIEASQIHITFDTLMQLLNPELKIIRFHLSSINGSNYSNDALSAILLNCPKINNLAFPWQSNVTNLNNCAKIKRITKLDEFCLYNISELIEPKIIASFANNNMAEKSRFELVYSIVIPDNYIKNVKALILLENIIFDVRVYPR